MTTPKLVLALVLCDVAAHGLIAGNLVEADQDLIKALAKDGSVDPHRDAVAAARKAGATVQRSKIELAAQDKADRMDALRIDIAKLRDLAGAEGTDEATKQALARELAAKEAALAAEQAA